MKRVPLVTVSLVASFALLTAFLWIQWHNSPLGKFNTFLKHDRAYYSRIATACDVLITRLPAGQALMPNIPGDDASLPEVLRNLEADSFYVATNQVLVRFGVGRISSSIVWETSSVSPQWQLVAVAGEGDVRRTVFEKQR